MIGKIAFALALSSIFLTFEDSAQAQESKAQATAKAASTQSIMQSIFDPMSSVLAFSFDHEAFASPKNRDVIGRDLKKLVRNIGQLEEHGKGQDRSFEYVAKSLGSDARRLERWFDKKRFEEARFVLYNMTENCIACHSNLPETRKFPAADKFFAKVKGDALPLLDRARLEIMGRRFDDALITYEAYFRSKEADPALITLLGAFTDYLKVSISVKSDFKRPQSTIEYLVARPMTPLHIKQQLVQWLSALKAFDAKNVLQNSDLAAARKVLEEGRSMMQFERDRDGLIHYLTAEAMLTRYIRARPDRGPDVGEAYFLLGTASSLTEHSYWISRAEFFFESAIRLAPSAPFAPKAYALLEENMVYGYSGSSGTHLPNDVLILLDELKRLVEQEHGKI